VEERENPRFHRLLRAFEERTGCAVLINTSFNVRGEPPVCSVEDAYRCFMATGIDYLVLGDYLIDKRQQEPRSAPPAVPSRSWIADEYERIDRSPSALRRFGLTIAVVLGVLAALMIRRNATAAAPLAAGAVVLILAAQFAPAHLAKFHRLWTMLSLVMGWIMTRVILTIVFFVVLTPIGLLQRLVGRRAFDVAFRTAAETYWKPRASAFDAASYEKQF